MADKIDYHLDLLAMSGSLQDELENPNGFFHHASSLAPPDTTEIILVMSFIRSGDKEPIRVSATLNLHEDQTGEVEYGKE